MPVDPQAQEIIDEVAGADDVDYDAIPVEAIRVGFDQFNAPPFVEDLLAGREDTIEGVPVRIYGEARPVHVPTPVVEESV